jgi:hypothetical protein
VLLGRRELSAILLALGAIAFYLLLLSTTPSGAYGQGGFITFSTNQTQEATQNVVSTVIVNQGNQGNGVTASVVNPSPENPPPNRRPREIVNIPNKPLPPSGGLPVVATVAGFVLTGTALLALGILIRRGSRR